MARADSIGDGRDASGELARLAFRHIEAEDAGDIEGTLGTFQADATFDLFPVGLRLSGPERIRRYYEYFFAVSRHHCTGYTVHGHAYGEKGLSVEMSVVLGYGDGSQRAFRVLTVFPYGETALLGERLYADTEFFRVIFGPLLAEMEPLAQ